MHKRKLILSLIFGLILTIFIFVLGAPIWAAPHFQARSVITYPTDGMTVSGVVEVTGIATHPNIHWYDVSYAPGAEPTGGSQWVSVAHVDNTQVENDVLATWDTTGIPDGQYSLALTVVGRDDPLNYQQLVAHLTVNNAQPVASPTPEQEPPTSESEPAPTAGVESTPTSVSIEQPATSTPRPSPTSPPEGEEAATPVADEEEGLDLPFDIGGLRSAFCNGILITAMLFLLWGLYWLAKSSIRWYLRRNKGRLWK